MSDRITVSAKMLEVLTSNHGDKDTIGAEPNEYGFSVPCGNVAANVYNVTVGTDALDGINLGWKDMEASTEFLCDLVSGVDNILGEDLDDVRDRGGDAEIVDSAIPIATYAKVQAALELDLASVTPDNAGDDTLDGVATSLLGDLGNSIVYQLLGMIEATEEVSQ